MEGVLRCSPEKVLDFNIFSGHQSHVALSLDNPSDTFVAFKIKTTAPRSYLVKPSSGVVRPKSSIQVNILLIPLHEQPKESVADRFLVQSTIIDSDRHLSKEEWNELTLSKEKLSERRLAVNFNWKGTGGPTGGSNAMEGDVSESLHHLIGRPLPQDSAELKQRYETIVAFCVALEKQKKELEVEIDDLRRKQTTGPRMTGVKGSAGLEYWQVGMLLLSVVFLLKLVRFL